MWLLNLKTNQLTNTTGIWLTSYKKEILSAVKCVGWGWEVWGYREGEARTGEAERPPVLFQVRAQGAVRSCPGAGSGFYLSTPRDRLNGADTHQGKSRVSKATVGEWPYGVRQCWEGQWRCVAWPGGPDCSRQEAKGEVAGRGTVEGASSVLIWSASWSGGSHRCALLANTHGTAHLQRAHFSVYIYYTNKKSSKK